MSLGEWGLCVVCARSDRCVWVGTTHMLPYDVWPHAAWVTSEDGIQEEERGRWEALTGKTVSAY